MNLCPECEQGKAVNCTGESLVGETLVQCATQGLYEYIHASASVGATLPEMQGSGFLEPAAPNVVSPLGLLASTGEILRLSEVRNGWNVWVTAEDVNGREIASSQAVTPSQDQEEGQVDDETNTRGPRALSSWMDEEVEALEQCTEQHGTLEVTSGGLTADMDQRAMALGLARSIIGDTKASKDAFTSPRTTPPATRDLISLAEYIVRGSTPWEQ